MFNWFKKKPLEEKKEHQYVTSSAFYCTKHDYSEVFMGNWDFPDGFNTCPECAKDKTHPIGDNEID